MSGLFDVEGRVDTKYSRGVRTPQYQPTGERPRLAELYNKEKAVKLINRINEAVLGKEISVEEGEFLKLAAYRHVQIRYDRVAEYYCHASKEMQALMEESALVILDIDDAIANGYVKLSNKLREIVEDSNKEK